MCPGCGVSEFDSSEALYSYILRPENNLTQEGQANGYNIRVAYRPTDLLVHQELDGERFDISRLTELRKKYADYYYFVLGLSKHSKEILNNVGAGSEQYQNLVQTLSFRMDNFVTLVTSARDTLSLAGFIFDRTYGFSPSTDLLFVFERDNTIEGDFLDFQLSEFGLGIGRQRFRFSKEDLDGAPYLNFEKIATTASAGLRPGD